jgi:hypothetical protein
MPGLAELFVAFHPMWAGANLAFSFDLMSKFLVDMEALVDTKPFQAAEMERLLRFLKYVILINETTIRLRPYAPISSCFTAVARGVGGQYFAPEIVHEFVVRIFNIFNTVSNKFYHKKWLLQSTISTLRLCMKHFIHYLSPLLSNLPSFGNAVHLLADLWRRLRSSLHTFVAVHTRPSVAHAQRCRCVSDLRVAAAGRLRPLLFCVSQAQLTNNSLSPKLINFRCCASKGPGCPSRQLTSSSSRAPSTRCRLPPILA